MRIIYAILLICIFFLILFTLFRARKRKDSIRFRICMVLFFAAVVVLEYLILTLSQSYRLSVAAYSFYFITMGWLCYAMFLFGVGFTESRRTLPGIAKGLAALLVLDSISLFANIWSHHALSFKVSSWNGRLWLIPLEQPPFGLHLALCYFLCLLFFICMLKNIITKPKLYKKQYFHIAASILIIMLLNAIFIIFKWFPLDFSVLSYGVMSILLHWYTFSYIPRHIAHQVTSLVIKEMTDCILVYDIFGQPTLCNHSAGQIFGEQASRYHLTEFCSHYGIPLPSPEQEYECDIDIDKSRYFHVSFQILHDKDGSDIGSYLQLYDTTQEFENKKRERHLMTHDILTGLHNMNRFYEQTQQMLAHKPEHAYILFCCDIYQFKIVNEFFGRETGDRVLCKIAESFKKEKRLSTYGRISSDRFAGCMKKADFSEEILHALSAEVQNIFHSDYPLHIYFGVYEIENNLMPVGNMCDRALLALKERKSDYTHTILYYNQKLHNKLMTKQRILAEFSTAIEQREFEIYLQPQIRLKDKSITKAEALARWNHHERGLISPGDFIPVFEESGLIPTLDHYIWDSACRQLRDWKEQGITDFSISVNISSHDFYSLDVYSVLTGLVEQYQISPENLNLEITESAFIFDLDSVLTLITRLQAYGFDVEMDDFGSGYSTLNTLKDIPANALKIDMGFLGQCRFPQRAEHILSAIIEMGKSLDMIIIAEGIEEQQQADMLSAMGCDYIQGYLYAKPMPIAAFEKNYLFRQSVFE